MGLREREEQRKQRKSVVASIAGIDIEKKEATVIELKPKEEIRSKKFPVSIKPSLHQEAKRKALVSGYSLNEVINQLLEKWTYSE